MLFLIRLNFSEKKIFENEKYSEKYNELLFDF